MTWVLNKWLYQKINELETENAFLREALVRIYRGDGLHGSVPAWELMAIAREALQKAGGGE